MSCHPCQELEDHLATPLEEVDNVVAWWGVSEQYDPKSHLLTNPNFDSSIPFSISLSKIAKYCLVIQGPAVPWSLHFPAVASQQPPVAMGSYQKPSEPSKQ